MSDKKGVIYILTNPSFPDYVKIGYADDIDKGKEMSLTAAAKLISGKKYSIAGPRFFKYKGEWLNDIRERMGF